MKKLEDKINDLEIKFDEKINNIRSSVNEANRAVSDFKQTSPEKAVSKKKAMIV